MAEQARNVNRQPTRTSHLNLPAPPGQDCTLDVTEGTDQQCTTLSIARPRAQSSPSQPVASPPLDYQAVLRLLQQQQQQEPQQPATTTSVAASEEDPVSHAVLLHAVAMAAHPRVGEAPAIANDDADDPEEELDATLAPFTSARYAAGDGQSQTLLPRGVGSTGVGCEVSRKSTADSPAEDPSRDGLAKVSGGDAAHESMSDFERRLEMGPAALDAAPSHRTTSHSHQRGAQAGGLRDQDDRWRQELERGWRVRERALEERVARAEAAAAASEAAVREMKEVVSELRAEQAQLRVRLAAVTSDTTGLIARLQVVLL
jgi:uncharacterized coiled-coil protein SlyX